MLVKEKGKEEKKEKMKITAKYNFGAVNGGSKVVEKSSGLL